MKSKDTVDAIHSGDKKLFQKVRVTSVDESLKFSRPSDVKLLEEDYNDISYGEGDSVVNPKNAGKSLKKIKKMQAKENNQMLCLRD